MIWELNRYLSHHGQLPENLHELGDGFGDDGPIYYQRTWASTYILWYGTSLGESCTYDSFTDEWTP